MATAPATASAANDRKLSGFEARNFDQTVKISRLRNLRKTLPSVIDFNSTVMARQLIVKVDDAPNLRWVLPPWRDENELF